MEAREAEGQGRDGLATGLLGGVDGEAVEAGEGDGFAGGDGRGREMVDGGRGGGGQFPAAGGGVCGASGEEGGEEEEEEEEAFHAVGWAEEGGGSWKRMESLCCFLRISKMGQPLRVQLMRTSRRSWRRS